MVFENELIASIIIAIVQGLTEWIPVSSSGHLVLAERILGFEGGGLLFDVALHFGTLMAVFVYFGGDIVDIIRDFFGGKWKTENGRLGVLIVIGTIPAAFVGFLLRNVFEVAFESLSVVAMGFAVTGVFLLIASNSRVGKNYDSERDPSRVARLNGNGPFGKEKFSYWRAFLVGIAQIFSLFPGVSRSGATIGSGLLLGLDERNAIKFSFLMSIPIIFGANILTIGNETLPSNLIWATLVSFGVGLVTIHLLYGKMLARRRYLRWYAMYALLLSLVLGIWLIWK